MSVQSITAEKDVLFSGLGECRCCKENIVWDDTVQVAVQSHTRLMQALNWFAQEDNRKAFLNTKRVGMKIRQDSTR